MSYFFAQYRGPCDVCEDSVEPGQKIGWIDGAIAHASCIERGRPPKKVAVVCQVCWLEKPCECDDEARSKF